MVNYYKTQNRNNRNNGNNKINRKNKHSRKHSKKHSRKHNQIGSGNPISSILQVQYQDIPVLDSLNVDYTRYYKPNQPGILAKEPGILFNQLRNASNSSEILLIMHDPDAPSDFDIARDREKGIKQEWIHWIAVFDSSGKKTLEYMGYKGPSPPPRTGKHHYIFDIYDLGKITKKNPDIITRLVEISKNGNRGGHNHIINALNDNNAGYKIASVSYTINSGRMD